MALQPKTVARALGWGRLAIGAAMVAVPAKATRGWVGADAETAGGQALTRALGVRDALLGFMALHTLDRPGVGARTVQAIAVCDLVDFGATVAARDRIPATGVYGVGALALGSFLAGTVVARKLDG